MPTPREQAEERMYYAAIGDAVDRADWAELDRLAPPGDLAPGIARIAAEQARADILAKTIGRAPRKFGWRGTSESITKRRMAHAYWAEIDRIRPDYFNPPPDDDTD